jgi:hypothetical protein
MSRTLTLPLAVAMLVLTAGCGGSDQPDSGSDQTSSGPTASSSTPAPDESPTGAPGPDPAPEPTKVTSTLVDYGDDGVVVGNRGDVSRLKGAPRDFTAFIGDEIERQRATKDEVCTEKPQLRVERVDVRGWAAGGISIPQCGGNGALWARTGGAWKTVWTDQTLPDCSVLTRYRFPAAVAGGECGTEDGNTRRYP